MKDIGKSIFARLKNKAREEKSNLTLLLERYAMERLFYRLSISEYRQQFILKGGMRLLSIWGESKRITRDADFLAQGITDRSNIEAIFKEICVISPEEDDGVKFYPETIVISDIKEENPYPGTRVIIGSSIDTAKLKLQIDIGFSDKLTPEAEIIDYPTILDSPSPQLIAYSVYTIIAEKFEAMVKLGIFNSRMKDFYDIWQISKQSDFDGSILKDAIINTFTWRKTSLPETTPFPFTSEFYEDPDKQRIWKTFYIKIFATSSVELKTVIESIASFLTPVITAIQQGENFDLNWDAEKQIWQ